MFDKERILEECEHVFFNWKHGLEHEDVYKHYKEIESSLYKNDYEGFKILIFQPVAIGDNVVASLGAELLYKKFPGCTIDFFTSTAGSVSLLEANPFINKVICDQCWDLVNTRDTTKEYVHGKPTEDGPVRKQYDLTFSLYWWNPPMVKSFLEDMDLETDYTRVKIYPRNQDRAKAQKFLEDKKSCITVGLQSDFTGKWYGDYQKLKQALESLPRTSVIEIGKGTGSYIESAAIVEAIDLCVCTEGSLSHVAAAVGTPTVTLSSIYKPEDVMVEFYQNKYLPSDFRHHTVRPKNWCKDHHCITYNRDDCVHKNPPYGFPDKFPPYMCRVCDHFDNKPVQKVNYDVNGVKTIMDGYDNPKTCINQISIDEIMDVVKLKGGLPNE